MTKNDCLRASTVVCQAYGFATFADLKELVIWKGYHASGESSLMRFRQLEKAFHTAQFLQWAAEEFGKERAYWVAAAAARLPPMTAERWAKMPADLKRQVTDCWYESGVA